MCKWNRLAILSCLAAMLFAAGYSMGGKTDRTGWRDDLLPGPDKNITLDLGGGVTMVLVKIPGGSHRKKFPIYRLS